MHEKNDTCKTTATENICHACLSIKTRLLFRDHSWLRILGHLSFWGTCRCSAFWPTCLHFWPGAHTGAPFPTTEVCLEPTHIEQHMLLARWCSVELCSGSQANCINPLDVESGIHNIYIIYIIHNIHNIYIPRILSSAVNSGSPHIIVLTEKQLINKNKWTHYPQPIIEFVTMRYPFWYPVW